MHGWPFSSHIPHAAPHWFCASCTHTPSQFEVQQNESVWQIVAAQGLGLVQLYPSFSSVRLRRLWILNDLYVVPEARKEGVGRALMERARRLAVETNAVALQLETAKTNASARRLYESLGYVRDDIYDVYELSVAP